MMDKYYVFSESGNFINLKNVIRVGYFSNLDETFKIIVDFGNGNIYKLYTEIGKESSAKRMMKRFNELFFDPNIRIIYSEDIRKAVE